MVGKRGLLCITNNHGKPRVRIQSKGRTVFDKTLDCSFHTKSGISKAIKVRDDIKQRLSLGIGVGDNGEEGLHLFSIGCQEYMDELEGARSTHLDYESIINTWWLPAFGNMIAEDITPRMIKQVLASKPTGRKRKKNALSVLKGVFDHLSVLPNPASFKIKKTDEDQRKPVQRYSVAERNALLSALEGEYQLYFTLLFACGLRPAGEVLALRWEDYDGQRLTINKTISRRHLKNSTKTYSARRVVVPTWAREILHSHHTRDRGEWIFLNQDGNRYTKPDRFNAEWKRVSKELNIPYRIPYVCRHTRAAELLSTGVSSAEAASQLGHSLQMFLNTYSEWLEDYSMLSNLDRFEGCSVAIT